MSFVVELHTHTFFLNIKFGLFLEGRWGEICSKTKKTKSQQLYNEHENQPRCLRLVREAVCRVTEMSWDQMCRVRVKTAFGPYRYGFFQGSNTLQSCFVVSYTCYVAAVEHRIHAGFISQQSTSHLVSDLWLTTHMLHMCHLTFKLWVFFFFIHAFSKITPD